MEHIKERTEINEYERLIKNIYDKVYDRYCTRGQHEWEKMSGGTLTEWYHCIWCGSYKTIKTGDDVITATGI